MFNVFIVMIGFFLLVVYGNIEFLGLYFICEIKLLFFVFFLWIIIIWYRKLFIIVEYVFKFLFSMNFKCFIIIFFCGLFLFYFSF